MKNWLKALLSETAFSVWWILSALSTLSTFFFHGLSGKQRFASAVSTLIGFAWANYRVFRNQEAEISRLRLANESHEARTSQLRITPSAGSRYILRPVSSVPKGDFSGIYLEFHLMIENMGRRNSTVNSFQVEIVRKVHKRKIQIFAYANNHYAGFAPATAERFEKMYAAAK